MDRGEVALTARGLLVRDATGTWGPPRGDAERWAAVELLLDGQRRVPAPSQAFLDRVESYLAPVAGKFNHARWCTPPSRASASSAGPPS